MKIRTTKEVYKAIYNQHHSHLHVFESYSAPDGDELGRPDQGVMYTAWGFRYAQNPIISARTTWDINREEPYKRNNEQHEYWLCVAMDDEE